MDNHEHEYHFDTLQLHAGQQVDSATNARAVPIYATTSFTFNTIDHALAIFANDVHGFAYSRYKTRNERYNEHTLNSGFQD